MLHGRVVRPPAVGETLSSVDETSARSLPGNVTVVRIGNFLGVVADTEWAAIKAAQTLAATWSDVSNLPDEAHPFDYVRTGSAQCDTLQRAERVARREPKPRSRDQRVHRNPATLVTPTRDTLAPS
ncbi:MAG TPA: hypothetical protein VKI44_41105 [Acetobacteraceae bacterium]|nr:hypothetical protein [Acetobacteraceae bacterium]